MSDEKKPPTEDILQFFNYGDTEGSDRTYETLRMFHDLAHNIGWNLPRCPERTVALRKLLEAKDAAVRSTIWKPQS